MGDGYPHTSSLVMLAFQKTRKIIAWNNPTWFEKTLLHFEQQIRFILNPNIEDSQMNIISIDVWTYRKNLQN